MSQRTLHLLALLFPLVVAACPEATDGEPREGFTRQEESDAATDEPSDEEDASDSAKDSSSKKDTGPSPALELTINEISARGTEWIEIKNLGGVSADLEGIRIADRDKDAGVPKLSEALTLPKGTNLAAGGYLLAVHVSDDAGSCPADLVKNGGACFAVTFGLSNKEGDEVFIVAKNDAVIASAEYPPSAVASGQTWSRLPDGTGAFAAGKSTPLAINASP